MLLLSIVPLYIIKMLFKIEQMFQIYCVPLKDLLLQYAQKRVESFKRDNDSNF